MQFAAQAHTSIEAHFVLHGIGALKSTLAEAKQTGDMLFLPAPAHMPCKAGPLRKLFEWLRCALVAWPNAQLVGKGDDDVWLSPPAASSHRRMWPPHGPQHRTTRS